MIKTETIVLDNKVRLVFSSDKSKNQTYAEVIVNYGGMNKKFKVKDKVLEISFNNVADLNRILEILNVKGD